MGRKIFISYKYWDDDVYPVPRFSDYHPKVRDYVSWLEDKFQNRTEHYYKGESDNEDLSMYSENYIWDKLKDKMYDSSLTIILISPNMKEPNTWENLNGFPGSYHTLLEKQQEGIIQVKEMQYWLLFCLINTETIIIINLCDFFQSYKLI